MFDGLIMFANGVAGFLTPTSLALAFGATLLGIVAGCMPGLSATLVITLLTTLTIRMAPNQAILVLVCAYNGAIYGGSRTAILLNIPGTAANAAACLDGYALARKGQAGRAMGIATAGSVVGTLFGLVCLALFTPLLGEIALSFGAFEFFWLAFLGVVLSGNVVAADPLKGWLAGFLGLFVACIGQEGMYAYERFSFGNADLAGGFSLIPVLVGAFGFSEVLMVMSERMGRPKIMEFGSVIPRVMDVLRHWRTIIRSGVIGVWVGILPGVGEDMAAWSSYATAKRLSKNPEEYGKGSVEGLMAAETGDNASVPGGIIPALALAIPGSAPCAVLLAAMIIHGVQAGPMLMVQNPQFVFDVVAMVLFSTLGILFFGLFFVRPLLKIAQIPRSLLMPAIFGLCVIGSYSLSSRLFDVYTMLGFGTLIFVMRQFGYPAAPFVLGVVLGDILDKNLRRGLVLSDGEILPFFTRPLSIILALLVVYTFVANVPSVNAAVKSAWNMLLDRILPWRRGAKPPA
jgi:putative tricarboxylic transport membrane protein